MHGPMRREEMQMGGEGFGGMRAVLRGSHAHGVEGSRAAVCNVQSSYRLSQYDQLQCSTTVNPTEERFY